MKRGYTYHIQVSQQTIIHQYKKNGEKVVIREVIILKTGN